MNQPSMPLFDVFQALRRREFNIGLAEYFLALEALNQGFGTGSRDDLIFMCQTLWANSEEEKYAVEAALAELLPAYWSEEELARRLAEAEPQTPQESSEVEQPAPSTESPAVESEPPPLSSIQGSISTSPGAEVGDRLLAPAIRFRSMPGRLDFVGNLPVTRRQMKRAWRYYRRMQRSGPPIELDVPATLEAFYRKGVLEQPVLVPRRSNQARLLLLIDEGGSMTPFRYIVQPLLNTAQQSGLARATAYYFHDAPGDYLFSDPNRTRAINFDRAVAPFAGAGVLVVSDAGSARGNFDKIRRRDTLDFARRLQRATPYIAWVNPTPEDRWPRTTAAAIRAESGIPMFTLNRAGLDAAVDVLRGRTD